MTFIATVRIGRLYPLRNRAALRLGWPEFARLHLFKFCRYGTPMNPVLLTEAQRKKKKKKQKMAEKAEKAHGGWGPNGCAFILETVSRVGVAPKGKPTGKRETTK